MIRESTKSLSLPRRQRLHRGAAEAIEAVYARNLGPYLPGARPPLAARPETPRIPDRAVDYSVRAGEAPALGVFAYEDAAVHWEAALDLLEDGGGEGCRPRHAPGPSG